MSLMVISTVLLSGAMLTYVKLPFLQKYCRFIKMTYRKSHLNAHANKKKWEKILYFGSNLKIVHKFSKLQSSIFVFL